MRSEVVVMQGTFQARYEQHRHFDNRCQCFGVPFAVIYRETSVCQHSISRQKCNSRSFNFIIQLLGLIFLRHQRRMWMTKRGRYFTSMSPPSNLFAAEEVIWRRSDQLDCCLVVCSWLNFRGSGLCDLGTDASDRQVTISYVYDIYMYLTPLLR